MAKESDSHWFKHDYNARRDPKLIRLSRIKGMKGIGIYWSLIEIMHEQEGSIGKDEISDISFELREDENNVHSVLNEFDLFDIQPYYYSNTRVLQNIDERRKQSDQARINVQKRWDKLKPNNQIVNTAVLPKTYGSDTIREEKNREEENTGFERFWNSYPKKKSKGDAIKSWKKIKPSPELQIKIQTSIASLKKSEGWKKDGGQFIPYPATWLNAMGWEDEAGKESQSEKMYDGLDLN